jgi:hypothetical protein
MDVQLVSDQPVRSWIPGGIVMGRMAVQLVTDQLACSFRAEL